MRALCAGMPTRRYSRVSASQAEFSQGRIDLASREEEEGHHGHGRRRKRQSGGGGDFFNCRRTDVCTRQMFGRICAWYICESGRATSDCVDHVRDSSLRCAECCQSDSSRYLCRCSEIDNKESFERCQRMLDRFD